MNTIDKNKKNNDIKDNNISFRCTTNEKTLIYEYAKRQDMSVGDFIIDKCIGEKQQCDIQFICEIQTLVNKLHSKQIKKREFVSKIEVVLNRMKWQ